MREILFRGKRTDNGEWVYGDLSQHKNRKKFIKCGNATQSYEVIPETVGQYTGLTDKNGNKIFEGDILGGFLDDEYPEYKTVVSVEWCENMWCARQGKNCPYLLEEDDMYCFEVIGNIHDNPVLIGGTDNG